MSVLTSGYASPQVVLCRRMEAEEQVSRPPPPPPASPACTTPVGLRERRAEMHPHPVNEGWETSPRHSWHGLADRTMAQTKHKAELLRRNTCLSGWAKGVARMIITGRDGQHPQACRGELGTALMGHSDTGTEGSPWTCSYRMDDSSAVPVPKSV